MQSNEPHSPDGGAEPYAAPVLGEATAIGAGTLFSGTINPDGGTIDFGD